MNRFKSFSWNLRGRLVGFDRQAVMGIINITDDSFYAQSRVDQASLAAKARKLIAEGADIIDLGACSTRPGSEPIDIETERQRLINGVRAIREIAPDILLSVDTFRSSIALEAINAGADVINDVSMASDPDMIAVVADTRAPYILTHNKATGANVAADVIADLSEVVAKLSLAGVSDVVIDPGFGFQKSVDSNFQLMRDLSALTCFDLPILVGISRKSMITRSLSITADGALNATTALNTIALMKGASILRVHDPAPAREAIEMATRGA